MPLKVRIDPIVVTLSDSWISEDDAKTLNADELRELLNEDLMSFIEEIPGGLVSHCEFYWSHE